MHPRSSYKLFLTVMLPLLLIVVVAFSIQPRAILVAPMGAFLNGSLPTTTPGEDNAAPSLLSEIDAFSDLGDLTPTAGLIPYDLIVPFWSDGALKSRWLAIPNDGTPDSVGEQIVYDESGTWAYPPGTVIVKHFEMLLDETDENSKKRLETRFLVHGEDRIYYALTYRWNDAGTDATLVPEEGLTDVLRITTATGSRDQKWYFPSTTDCFVCHNDAARFVLGPNARQFNRDNFYPETNTTANQLIAFSEAGFLDTEITQPDLSTITTLHAIDDSTASLEGRARSYLDSNCAYCHVPGGVGRAVFDARFTTDLENQGLINGFVLSKLGIQNPMVIAPGDTARSVVYYRMARRDTTIAMPPRGKNKVDEKGLALIAEWIHSLVVSVQSFSPASGPAGTVVTLRGNRLEEVTSIQFGTAEASFTLADDNILEIIVPEGASSGALTLSTDLDEVQTLQAFTVTPAETSPNFVFDGSFEVSPAPPVAGTLSFETGETIGSWSVVAGDIDLMHRAADDVGAALPAGSGEHVIDLHGTVAGRLEQPLIDLIPETRYALTFFYAVAPGLDGPAEARVRFGSTLDETWMARNPGNEVWLPAVYTFETTASNESLTLEGLSSVVPQNGVLIDQVTVSPCPDCGPAPSISTISKSSASPGNEITLNGRGLSNPLVISFNGFVSPGITAVNDTELRAIVPEAETTGPIRVTTEQGTAESVPFSIVSTSGTDVEDDFLPQAFKLEANYPNPFSTETTFTFDLPEPAFVQIDVYDLQGRHVQTLSDQFYPAGQHQVLFERGSLPGGHYLYRMTAANLSKSGLMQVVK